MLIIFFVIPGNVFAHAGFEKRVGNTVIFVKQSPISPLVGEKVTMYLSLRDVRVVSKSLNDQDLVNFPVIVSVIDTYYGDESKDKVIHKEQLITDGNGSFTFTYTFERENYFDIELEFKDKNDKKQNVGFLIQPRSTKNVSYRNIFNTRDLILSFGAGSISILVLLFLRRIIAKVAINRKDK